MRIIDKNYDYYDYLQDPSDNLVFDRRGSFLLTKESVCDGIHYAGWYDDENYRIGLLQCGATYWLLLFTITAYNKSELYLSDTTPKDYDIEILATCKDYKKPRQVIALHIIHFNEFWKYGLGIRSTIADVKKVVADLQKAVVNKEYEQVRSFCTHTKTIEKKGRWIRETQTIPILSACGIANIITPEDMYNALDEHFALEKSDAESTVAEGTTNNDKIVNHGFDVKASFRGNT